MKVIVPPPSALTLGIHPTRAIRFHDDAGDREFDYRTGLFLRFVGAGAGSDARNAMSATSLASRSSRRRAMFFRTSMACRSASANARSAVFGSQSLAVRARDAFGRRLCRFPGDHLQPALG
ncbi:hypothetical protein J2R96_005136 [Bradyrhizobium elkanii]|nr:hypothetical protein [Bradyrhizobium elkanii]